MPGLLPLWIHCIEYWKAGVFVFRRAKLEPLYESWKLWVGPQWTRPSISQVSEQSLCS